MPRLHSQDEQQAQQQPLPQLPPNSAEWEELLAEGIHLCKINKEAELSAQPTMSFWPFNVAMRIVGVAAREPSRHESLLASGVVDALLWLPMANGGTARKIDGTGWGRADDKNKKRYRDCKTELYSMVDKE